MPEKHNLLAVILGGGAGSRLFPLTQQRSKPAVPLGGKYRLVDVPISNCINSNVIRIFVDAIQLGLSQSPHRTDVSVLAVCRRVRGNTRCGTNAGKRAVVSGYG